MNIKEQLKDIEQTEKKFLKQIDDEVALEGEIEDIANYTAEKLSTNPMASFTIQDRTFVIVAAIYNNGNNIQLVAREKNAIVTSTSKVIKADLEIDKNYTKKENLVAGIKALLGHITGCIKPETLD